MRTDQVLSSLSVWSWGLAWDIRWHLVGHRCATLEASRWVEGICEHYWWALPVIICSRCSYISHRERLGWTNVSVSVLATAMRGEICDCNVELVLWQFAIQTIRLAPWLNHDFRSCSWRDIHCHDWLLGSCLEHVSETIGYLWSQNLRLLTLVMSLEAYVWVCKLILRARSCLCSLPWNLNRRARKWCKALWLVKDELEVAILNRRLVDTCLLSNTLCIIA